ncbi:sigma-54-dependent Fis family transcriptional regulator [Desulfamplus magnetovallimortis]|nr:sigma-54-dependent Fis family transcriptional regulator [Desulfamplus magnetovallimortis]
MSISEDERSYLIESVLIRKRLTEIRVRMDRVANAWTVDNYEDLLGFYIDILPRVMRTERCTIYIIEMGTDKICSMLGTGLDKKQIQPPRKGSIAGEVISTGVPIIRNNLDKQHGFHTEVDAQTGFITRNTVCVPIKSLAGYGVTGAIQILNKKGRKKAFKDDQKDILEKESEWDSFSQQDLEMLEQVAHFLSMSIESIILNQEIIRISSQLNFEVERFDKEYFRDTPFIAESSAMKDVLEMVKLVCNTPVNVLLQGENGTGKELIARLIHKGSERRDKSLVAVNCAAIPENLMESEFFGYEKGAFTGADQRKKGRFEEANGGTLLLDEVADMPAIIQPKFLRAIQEGEGCRLGGNKVIKYDLRIICATNKDLRTEIKKGRFREDLFFRLFSVEIQIPPLRERKEDIIPLAMSFLEELSKKFNKKLAGFSPEVLNLFEAFHWPGNIRQLRREVERLIALTPSGEMIFIDKCSPELQKSCEAQIQCREPSTLSIPEQVKILETSLIGKALKEAGGNLAQTSRLLGITRQGLYKKLKRYQIKNHSK